MLRRVLARLGRALNLARLFDLPDRDPDRMIAASIGLYIGLGVIIAITVSSYWEGGPSMGLVRVFGVTARGR